jgi:2-keto-4-pentenoate hydratase/2-oxohepta-3-ene-1,7-dioic acid hydratase in catechol pathway
MKFARTRVPGPDGDVARLVVVDTDGDRIIDLATAERLRLQGRGASGRRAREVALTTFPGSLAAALSTGDEFLDAVGRALDARGDDASAPLDGQSWLPSVDAPLLRDCSAFEEHLVGYHERLGLDMNMGHFEMPAYYKTSPSRLIGHEAEVPWPHYTDYLDYELELGFVVGKVGRDLDPEAAERLLFGVTVFNDFSARDIQAPEMRLGLGPTKSKDFASALGPWVTTIDEVDVHELEMIARVNGEEWSRGSSSSMIWTPGELVAYISQGDELHPGDVIGSGTAPRGSALELGRKLSPGDEVELEVTGVGVLRNVIGPKQPTGWTPPKKEPKIFGKSRA